MTNRKLRVRIDAQVCVGNAMCVVTAPKSFALNQERQSQVIAANADSNDLVLEAASHCPVSAITVEDADSGEQLFPAPGPR